MTIKYNASATDLIPEGEHECIITASKAAESMTGTPYVRLTLQLRDGGRHLYDTFWLSEKARPYAERRMNGLMGALKVEDGTEFESDAAWGMAMEKRAVVAVVKHKYDDFKSEDVAYVSYYRSSDLPMPAEVPEEDLPF